MRATVYLRVERRVKRESAQLWDRVYDLCDAGAAKDADEWLSKLMADIKDKPKCESYGYRWYDWKSWKCHIPWIVIIVSTVAVIIVVVIAWYVSFIHKK